MSVPAAKPIGIILQPTQGGAIFELRTPEDQEDAKPDSHVTVWNYHHQTCALARFRGLITEAGEKTASFIVTESQVDPTWPEHIEPMGAGNPVYLAQEGSFNPDMSRLCRDEREFAELVDLAEEHQRMTGIKPAAAAMVPELVYDPDQDLPPQPE